jgi:hypothetical protein
MEFLPNESPLRRLVNPLALSADTLQCMQKHTGIKESI